MNNEIEKAFQNLANDLFESREIEIKMVDQDNGYFPVMYEELPRTIQKELDDIAAEMIDMDRGRIAVIGSAQSGKTFLIHQLVGNFDRYTDKLGRSPMHFIRLNENDMVTISSLPNTYTSYINSLVEELDCSETDICFVVENPKIATRLISWTDKARVFFETNRSTFIQIIQSEKQNGNSKVWASWLYTDLSDILLSKKELIDVVYTALNERMNEIFKVELTRKMITMFVSYTIKKMPEIILDDGPLKGKLIVPVGFWLSAFRKMAGVLSLSEAKELKGRDGNLVISRVVQEVYNYVEEIFRIHVDQMYESNNPSGETMLITGPDGQTFQVNMMSGFQMEPEDEEFIKELGDSESDEASYTNIENLQEKLQEEIIGQEEAVQKISDGMIVPAAGLNDPTKPIRSMLFLGPTGVGKTKMATTLAENLLDKPLQLVRIDMSEYSQPHEAAKLLGAPPGYAGFEQGGVLTNAVKRNPYSLILLDEIEKAHPKIWDSFLQILDAGRMTDGQGQEVDFTKTVVVMTSNIGAKESQHVSIGFGAISEKEAYNIRQQDSHKIVMKALEETFRPELLNRIDEVVSFNEISKETAMKIIDKEIKILSERMDTTGYTLEPVPFDILDEVLVRSNITKYGARDIQRVILRTISNPIAKSLVQLKKKEGEKAISLMFDDNKNILVKAS